MEQNEANSLYNSLQVDLRGKVTNLNLQVAYTFSSMDPTTNNGGDGFDLNKVTNSYCGWKYDWGPSIFDRTHVVFVNFVYDIPFFRSSSNNVEEHRSVAGSCPALSPHRRERRSIWAYPAIPFAEHSELRGSAKPSRCDQLSEHRYYVATGQVGNNTIQWFDPRAFASNFIPGTAGTSSQTATFGTLRKNALRGPGRQNWNLALFKQVAITERLRFEFRTEAYNVWNHTQFRGDVMTGGINDNIGGGADTGKITSAWDPRTLQFGAKLIF